MARVIGHLRDSAAFRDYVKMLQDRRDQLVSRLLSEADASKVESLRGEARATDTLLRDISNALKDLT